MDRNGIVTNHSVRVQIDTIPNLRVDVYRIERDMLIDDISPINWKIAKTGDWVVRVTGNWQDSRNIGNRVSAVNTWYYSWPACGPSKKQLANAVRTAARDHFEHEIDEGLWVDGERVFDPH